MQLLKLLFSLIFLSAIKSYGAACCGGGLSMPNLIAGDDRAQLSLNYGSTNVVIDNVDSKGIWRRSQDHQVLQTVKLEGAHIFKDLWQAGFSLPVIQREFMNQSFSGLGDVSLSLGYEYLSDWNYNPFRPKGTGFIQLRIPTGRSRADSEVGGLDSRGNGFWAIGAGTMLTKTWGRWDAFALTEFHKSFAKEVNTSMIQGTLRPGNGSTVELGGGFNWSLYRWGASVSENYDDPVNLDLLSGAQTGKVERYATASMIFSYLPSDDWAWIVSMSDQTLLGSPMNTSLGRGIAIQMQRRWSR